MNIVWKFKPFQELSPIELYEVIKLRLEIFVVEQNCPYQDADGKDLKAYHLMGYSNDGVLVAYCRILPAGISYAEVSIGRVVTSSLVRRSGAGKQLMLEALKCIEEKFGNSSVRISAQSYLLKFYESFGFKTIGKEYLEDNIPHMEMLLQKQI
jgi:ElaA protein